MDQKPVYYCPSQIRPHREPVSRQPLPGRRKRRRILFGQHYSLHDRCVYIVGPLPNGTLHALDGDTAFEIGPEDFDNIVDIGGPGDDYPDWYWAIRWRWERFTWRWEWLWRNLDYVPPPPPRFVIGNDRL